MEKQFKLECMDRLELAIAEDLQSAIDQVIEDRTHFVVASDFDDPINHILIQVEKAHFEEAPEEAFLVTVSTDNITVFFLDRRYVTMDELAIHLNMTPAEFMMHAPDGFMFVASGEWGPRTAQLASEYNVKTIRKMPNNYIH